MLALRLARLLAACLAIALLTGCASTATGTRSAAEVPVDKSAGQNVRGVRYCEVLPVFWRGGNPTAEVYNTLGVSECPAADWSDLDAGELKQQTDALTVVLNGPRAWDMDEIRDDSGSTAPAAVRFGAVPMIKRAEVELGIRGLLRGELEPYTQTQRIERTTTFVYRAGRPIRLLTSPDGVVYAMQSHDLTKVASASALETMDLALPDGWAYHVVNPSGDVVLSVKGYAEVLRDDLGGTYQRVPADVVRRLR